jgi:hypothetical protein
MGLCGAGTKVVGLSQSLTLILFFNFGLCWSCDQGSDACSLDFTCSGSLSYKSSVPGLVVFNGITKKHPQIFTVLFVFFGSMVPKIGVPPNPPNYIMIGLKPIGLGIPYVFRTIELRLWPSSTVSHLGVETNE